VALEWKRVEMLEISNGGRSGVSQGACRGNDRREETVGLEQNFENKGEFEGGKGSVEGRGMWNGVFGEKEKNRPQRRD